MLTFFRRIRKGLLDGGRTSKYILYTIGEIALVVIGILIALQINNWNEDRKESNLEQEYLLRISNDLASDMTIFEEKLQLAQREIDLYKSFTYKAYETQNNIDEFADLITSINWTADNLILQDKTYEELTSTGNANLIKNLDLRNQIADYYRSYEVAKAHIAELNQTSFTIALKAEEVAQTVKYWGDVVGTIPLQPFMLQDGHWEFINNPSSDGFRLWENAAGYYAGKQMYKAEYYTNLKNDAKELIQLINENLKK